MFQGLNCSFSDLLHTITMCGGYFSAQRSEKQLVVGRANHMVF
ncbi:hypothetical protein HMPREF1990_00182 [Porphyromonas gingivalis W4087]|uniref:Uncharacterized protein n=1 Tax=Porphyromonas gingivalis F0570 TaxID=1227271 RepID=A0A0E2LT48_PORGN|nr:hypothetical protein HMPREF1553_01428 [Porphyromonas gingivalis F0568]ERJ68389.1 hypothetical protein HMPREF1555_00438 [Porphyromonas gingivalis F0570]ERJ81449.1 hypothetical protein HMPREF1988_02015 [Porphyromonas gingivalis F0185]ERJ91175.1 hypothetical protein HMPREF1990_00182 [Porphyromonas gingivalis W4087]